MYGTTKYLANVGNVLGKEQPHRKILATILCCSRNISLCRIFRYALRYVTLQLPVQYSTCAPKQQIQQPRFICGTRTTTSHLPPPSPHTHAHTPTALR